MDGPIHQSGVYQFEQFELDASSRSLTRNGVAVPLANRLFDTLLYLVEHPQQLVERGALFSAVWPARSVDEGSLARAISSLRAALKEAGLDDNLIVTVPGRGYRFNARVARGTMPAAPRFVPGRPVAAPQAALAPPAPTPQAANPSPWIAWITRPRSAAVLALLAVLGLAVLIAAWPARDHVAAAPPSAPFDPPPRSVAVMAFNNASGDPAQEYFSDGISEELINALGRLDSLKVAARMSSFTFKGSKATIAEIARALNVDRVLEGSVQRAGSRVHVTAELIDGRTGFQIWARRYDRDEHDILIEQSQIAEEVAAALKGVLLDEDLAKLNLGGTSNARAFDAYLSGLSALETGGAKATQAAVDAFSTAIEADPDYAEAWVERSRARSHLAVATGMSDAATARHDLDLAEQDAQRAVILAPKLGAAHARLAAVLTYGLKEFGRAAEEYDTALSLAPEDAVVLTSYGGFQQYLGHTDNAIAAERRAVALDPLQPVYYAILAQSLIYGKQFDAALVALRHAQHLQPRAADVVRIGMGNLQLETGDAAAAAKTCAGQVDYHDLACLAWAEHVLGNQPAAEAALQKLRQQAGDSAAYLYAGIYALWGQPDEAQRWLKTAYDLRDPGLVVIKIDPRLAAVRGTPVYRDIVARLGFPP